MTGKELKRMSRGELLEMLLAQTREVERLQNALAQAEQELSDRQIRIENAGSIAHAALELSGIFEAAQNAADVYLLNAGQMEERTREKCLRMEEETRERCKEMIARAEQETTEFWKAVREQIKEPFRNHLWWMRVMEDVESHIPDGA